MRLSAFAWGALALASSLFVGCAEQDPDLWLFAAVPPDDSCEFAVPSASNFEAQLRGTLDVSFGGSYVLAVAAENTLVESESVEFASGGGGGTQGGLTGVDWEANRINVENARIRFDGPDGFSSTLESRELPFVMGVGPGDRMVAALEVVPSSVTQDLAAQMAEGLSFEAIIELEFEGRKLSESEVGSNTFRFPLTICNGCLWGVAFADGEVVPPCNVGQDLPSCTLNPTACEDDTTALVGPDGNSYVVTPGTANIFRCPGDPVVPVPVCAGE